MLLSVVACRRGGVQLRYTFRLHPTPCQRVALSRAFGSPRVVFNDGLAARREAHAAGPPYIPDGVLSTRVIPEAKKTLERAWLGEVSSVVLQRDGATASWRPQRASSRTTTRTQPRPSVAPEVVPVVLLLLRAGPGQNERPTAKSPSGAIELSISELPIRL